MEIRELLALAQGRWREILIDAGMPADSLVDRHDRPCPRCGGRDRFVALDVDKSGLVHCRRCFSRHTNPKARDGLNTLCWWLGCRPSEAIDWLKKWLGVVDGEPIPKLIPMAIEPKPEPAIDPRLAEDADRWFASMKPQWRFKAAVWLGLPVEPLERLRVGWAEEYRATTWPMRDPDGVVVGVRLRCPKTSRKWAVRGSRAGLFYPCDQEPESVLFACEGPTDTAAVLSLGLPCVGVPSAGSKADWVAAYVRKHSVRRVIVIADSDQAGTDGADRIGFECREWCEVRTIHPRGHKDVRAWVLAARGDVLQAIGVLK